MSENNGYNLDKAPNGAESKLFKDLLDNFNGNRVEAIKAKAKIYSDSFINWFGDWEKINTFNLNNIDTSKVDVLRIDKPWKNNPNKKNDTIRIYLKNQPNKGYFELVKDEEFGIFSVHFKTATKDGKYNNKNTEISTKEERKILFKEIIKAIPNGAL